MRDGKSVICSQLTGHTSCDLFVVIHQRSGRTRGQLICLSGGTRGPENYERTPNLCTCLYKDDKKLIPLISSKLTLYTYLNAADRRKFKSICQNMLSGPIFPKSHTKRGCLPPVLERRRRRGACNLAISRRDGDPGYMSRKIRKFQTGKFDTCYKRKF